MGLFNFFKRQKATENQIHIPNNEIIVYFKHGLLDKIEQDGCWLSPDNADYYSVRYINSDGITYDLEIAASIENIAAPTFDDFSKTDLGVTGNLAYVLRMKASELKGRGKFETALALLKKATELMPISGVIWL